MYIVYLIRIRLPETYIKSIARWWADLTREGCCQDIFPEEASAARVDLGLLDGFVRFELSRSHGHYSYKDLKELDSIGYLIIKDP